MRIVRIVCVLVVLAMLPAPSKAAGPPPGFVNASGSRLFVDGKPWRAIGANIWDMDTSKALANDLTGCYYQHTDLDAYFEATFSTLRTQMHATAVRTFAFLEQYTGGGRDWSSTDKLLYYAQKHNIRVIPVFGGQAGSCGSPTKTASWYHCTTDPACLPGYKQTDMWGTSYRSYVVAAAARYRDNPTVAFWQLMNEPMNGRPDAQDPTALLDFARDMVRAIRLEAGDQHHLINLGTVQASHATQQYRQILDCPGGCTDLTEVHDYSAEPLQGTPLDSSVTVRFVMTTDGAAAESAPVAAPIDGWTSASSGTPAPRIGWAMRIDAPAGGAWPMYVDQVTVNTLTGPHVYGFEAGTDGFRATGASVSRTTAVTRSGSGALRLDVQNGAGTVTLVPPAEATPILSVDAFVRPGFRAPAAAGGKGIAPLMHSAVVAQDRPFFTGEAGITAAVQSLTQASANCPTTTVAQRATALDAMLSVQTDDEHGSAGFFVWDWKDPSLTTVTATGAPQVDPTYGCYSVVPGDPAVAVLAKWADARGGAADPLPQPPPLPADAQTLIALKAVPSTTTPGASIPLQFRLTKGGSPLGGALVRADGGCTGSKVTNALGMAVFSCTAQSALGSATTTVSAECGTCSVAPQTFALTVMRNTAIILSARAGVVERGSAVPLVLTLKVPSDVSLAGTTWSVPECGLDGTFKKQFTSVMLAPLCILDASHSAAFVLHLNARDADGVTYSTQFVALVFDRIYPDASGQECIGVSADIGWVGGTDAPSPCRAGNYGYPSSWFFFDAGAPFTPAGRKLLIDATSGGRRVTGQFEYIDRAREFSAIVTSTGGTRSERSG